MKKITDLTSQFGSNEADTGRSEVQIALFSDRIQQISGHLSIHKKDKSSRFGLIQLVNKRKKLLKYLNRKNPERYQKVIKALGLRK